MPTDQLAQNESSNEAKANVKKFFKLLKDVLLKVATKVIVVGGKILSAILEKSVDEKLGKDSELGDLTGDAVEEFSEGFSSVLMDSVSPSKQNVAVANSSFDSMKLYSNMTPIFSSNIELTGTDASTAAS